jgi:hypothetical protein
MHFLRHFRTRRLVLLHVVHFIGNAEHTSDPGFSRTMRIGNLRHELRRLIHWRLGAILELAPGALFLTKLSKIAFLLVGTCG